MESPIVRFGVIADVQYADHDNGYDFAQLKLRRFRNSVNVLSRAVAWWNTQQLGFIAHVGDLIDGKNNKGHSIPAMQRVLAEFEKAQCKTHYFAIGNHELYNFEKSDLQHFFRTKSNYFHFAPAPGVRMIQLDSYHINCITKDNSAEFHLAMRILQRENPQCLVAGTDWFAGIKPTSQRFNPYNGALGVQQLAWLDETLAQAEKAREIVIILAHTPFYNAAATFKTVCWDCDEALSILAKYSCVVACVCGHEHEGGYAVDANGVHHITLPAALEVPADDVDAFGVISVFPDHLHLEGRGMIESKDLAFPKRFLAAHPSAAAAASSALDAPAGPESKLLE